MIRIEASNINYGGSFNLLKDLLDYCNSVGYNAEVYVKYNSIYEDLSQHNYRNIKLIKTSNLKTIIRYCKHTKSTLFFCSLPPFSKALKSYVYFHSEYFATRPFSNNSFLNLSGKLKKILYYYWIKFNCQNVDNFICQTEHIKLLLDSTYSIQPLVKPFFHIEKPKDVSTTKYDFIYPAINSVNKNIPILLSALHILRKKKDFTFILTIDQNDLSIIGRINEINNEFPNTIINVGILNHSQVFKYLSRTRCLVFPSLAESFGLPLIEAVSLGLTVISADLPYTYNCIDNPITFNPQDVNDISDKLLRFLVGDYKQIVQKSLISDCKSDIISLLV